MWDLVWIVYGFYSWQVLMRSYFEQRVFTADGFWRITNKALPVTALLVFYRAAFFYGTSRWIAWTMWAHVVHQYSFDLSCGVLTLVTDVISLRPTPLNDMYQRLR